MHAVNYVPSGSDTSRGPSQAIWKDLPRDILWNPNVGMHFFDDFLDFGLPGTQTTEINLGRYKVYNTGAGKVMSDVMPSDVSGNRLGGGGIISMLCDSDNDQSVIGTHACPYTLDVSAGKLWFEARIATTSIATDMTQIFVGLANNSEITYGAAIPLANADAIGTAVSLLGFTRLEDGLGAVNTSYSDKATSWTHVEVGAGQIAANTWLKVGFTVDRTRGSAAVQFFFNGVARAAALSASTLNALTNLNAQNLGPCFAQFADSGGAANYAYLDWWRVAQLF